jgi:diguanylate cyclase (GGDEF)-like protein
MDPKQATPYLEGLLEGLGNGRDRAPAAPSLNAAGWWPPRLPEGVLSGITHLLASEGAPDRVLEAVREALTELVPHDALTLFEVDEPLRVLRPLLAAHRFPGEVLAIGPVPYGTGVTGLAAETRTPQLVNEVHLDPRAQQVPNAGHEPESMVAVPLLARGELKGVVCLYRLGEGSAFSLEEFKLAVVMSELAALAIDNAQIRARLETEVITDHLTSLYNHRYFHERLAEELRRSNRQKSRVGLLIYDIDDFKRVNDTYGHLVGDQVLRTMASLSREICRQEDVLCRIGGEEFGVILPGCTLEATLVVAERLRAGIAAVDFPVVGRVTVSVGVAEGPFHASSPRELITCADLALLEAKAAGKDRVLVYHQDIRPREHVAASVDVASETTAAGSPVDGQEGANPNGHGMSARLAGLAASGEFRSVAHLRVLQSVSTRLNQLNDVGQIGEAITGELRSLIDYHNCRVFLLQADGKTLLPIAFRGNLAEYQDETIDMLKTEVGQGVTGYVALSGESHYAPDGKTDPFAVEIAGTDEIDESLLAVPLKYGGRVIGVIVLAKLGIDQFDGEDMRLLEGLAANAATAFENARLLQMEREAAVTSTALLQLSQALTKVSETESVLAEALASIPSMLGCSDAGAWMRDPDTGHFRLVADAGVEGERREAPAPDIPEALAVTLGLSMFEPFVIGRLATPDAPRHSLMLDQDRDILVLPMHWEPAGQGAIAVGAPAAEATFSDRDMRFGRGIADITSLALGNAQRFGDLEKTYIATVEALANALEAQDEYTSDHCRALAEMSKTVGQTMGLSPERVKILELGALFHDIGKIGVRSEIIRKPGPLTAGERREMNRHPEIGDRILEPVLFLQPVRPIVRASHERWDGNGYPDGLKGEEIPLEARIVFVCDAFHAMSTDRPYRAALPEAEAIRRLRLSAGTQFDAGVVRVFCELLKSGSIHFH